MAQTLITFLGRGRDDLKTGYRITTYRFPDGQQETTAFFGLALCAKLKPQKLMILGTNSSQWGVLVEHLAAESGAEEARLELMEAEAQGVVTQAQLDSVCPLVKKALGTQVQMRLIPHGKSAEEQIAILHAIADGIRSGQVSIDVTHGYRHLGMVGFLSAFMLERLGKNLQVKELWYGALDMAAGDVTPVLKLDGLSAVQRWNEALARFDANGDYGVFAPLLEADGLPHATAQCLVRAAYLERAHNVTDAAKQLRTVLHALDGPLAGASELFRPTLQRRLRWARETALAEQQRLLALQAYRRGDWLRAAILGLESFITRLCQETGADPLDFKARKLAEKSFRQTLAEQPAPKRKAYSLLTEVRNSMAHGTPPNSGEVKNLVREPDRLARELEATLSRLING